MQTWSDYDLENPSTWVPMAAPTVSQSWVDRLTKIGGLNPHGKPMLVWRWGASYSDPMSVDGGLKYWLSNREQTLEGFTFTCPVTDLEMFVEKMEDVPPAVLVAVPKYSPPIELGERRIIIEKWVSSEFLARSGRYTDESTRDNGESVDYPFCRNCHAELPIESSGEPKACDGCGSKRYYFRTERDPGNGQLLHTNPVEGCYDFFCRLEFADGSPAPADERALKFIERLWREANKPRREKIKDMLVASEPQRALNERATSPANPFQGPAV